MKYAIHPAAEAELAQYYREIDSKLGVRFYYEIERLIHAVCEHPDRYFRFNPPARRAWSRQFPSSVVYLDQPNQIWIVAVMHARRKPGHWR